MEDKVSNGATQTFTSDGVESSVYDLGPFSAADARTAREATDKWLSEVWARPDRYAKTATRYLTAEDVASLKATVTPQVFRDSLQTIAHSERLIRREAGKKKPDYSRRERELLQDLLFYIAPHNQADAGCRTTRIQVYYIPDGEWRDRLIVRFHMKVSGKDDVGAKGLVYSFGWKRIGDRLRIDSIGWEPSQP